MFYTYVLLDKNTNFYIGYTKDLKKRIKEHIKGSVFATKSKLPIELIYYESCKDHYDAIKKRTWSKVS